MADDHPPRKEPEPDLPGFVCHHLQLIGDAIVRSGRKRFRAAVDVDGLRVGLNAQPPRAQPAEDFGTLPEKVKELPRAAKRIFALIRDTRAAEDDANRNLDSKAIEDHFSDRTPDDDIAIDTVRHMLKLLRETEEVWSHPVLGYVLGRVQPELPFDARQPAPLPGPMERG